MPKSDGRISRSVSVKGRPKTSEVEWAGSVDTSSTRRPPRLAVNAVAAAHVVLPTPPLPPKKSTCRRKRSRTDDGFSTARQGAERRMLDAHAPVPQVEFLEQQ